MKVSVLMITYNHEKLIAQAIDSALMQQVNFDYEIVIGEDCSTDKTREIIIDYQKKYPDKIRLLLHEKNLGGGGLHNESLVYKACQGEYIAWLEGDDYWTSPHKLQMQVDFLDKYPDCVSCFHPYIDIYEDESQAPEICKPALAASKKRIFTFEELLESQGLLEGNIIHLNAMMSRNGLRNDFPDWYYTCGGIGDWAHSILTAQQGNIGYIDEVMAAYRIHGGGSYTSSSIIKKLKTRINFFQNLNTHLNFKYNNLLRSRISDCCYELCKEYAINEQFTEAKKYLLDCFLGAPFNRHVSRKKILKLFVYLYFVRFKSFKDDFSTETRYVEL